MSNASKFWAARIASWILLSVESTLVVKAAMDAGNHQLDAGSVIKLVICTAATVAVMVAYYHFKNNRWVKGLAKTPNQIEVEALAAYAAQQQKEKQLQQQAAQNKESPTPRLR